MSKDGKKVFVNDGRVVVQKGQVNAGNVTSPAPTTSQAKPPEPTPPKDQR